MAYDDRDQDVIKRLGDFNREIRSFVDDKATQVANLNANLKYERNRFHFFSAWIGFSIGVGISSIIGSILVNHIHK